MTNEHPPILNSIQELYRYYTRYCQEGIARAFQLINEPAERERYAELNGAVDFNAFEDMVNSMAPETRASFLRRITSGVDFAILATGQDLANNIEKLVTARSRGPGRG